MKSINHSVWSVISINKCYHYSQACPRGSLDYRHQRNSGKGQEEHPGVGRVGGWAILWQHTLQTVLTLCYCLRIMLVIWLHVRIQRHSIHSDFILKSNCALEYMRHSNRSLLNLSGLSMAVITFF